MLAIFKKGLFLFYMYRHLPVHHMCVQRPQKSEEDVESTTWCWEWNLGPVQEYKYS